MEKSCNENKGSFLVLSGPSGSGKNTLIDFIRETDPTLRHSVSATTRPMRGSEQEGVAYYFKTREEFEKLVEEGEFIEYDCFNNNYYGTLKKEIEKLLGESANVALDLTVPGAVNIKKAFGDRVKTVFILPMSFKTLKERLDKRKTESAEKIRERIKAAAENEIGVYGCFDYIIFNDKLEDSKRAIISIYRSFRDGGEADIKEAEKYKQKNQCVRCEELVRSLKKEAEEMLAEEK